MKKKQQQHNNNMFVAIHIYHNYKHSFYNDAFMIWYFDSDSKYRYRSIDCTTYYMNAKTATSTLITIINLAYILSLTTICLKN